MHCQVADPKKIAIGGHSYGAFMAANLVAHAPHLFACAIAQSGAYNRTLTPFSFQVRAGKGTVVRGTAAVDAAVGAISPGAQSQPNVQFMPTCPVGRRAMLSWELHPCTDHNVL